MAAIEAFVGSRQGASAWQDPQCDPDERQIGCGIYREAAYGPDAGHQHASKRRSKDP
jgi:hypothetical protein